MPLLEFSKVSKSYGKGDAKTRVLVDTDLQIHEGEFVAIVGYSGAGKTTLISLLAGKAGIGYFLWNSYNGGNYGAMVASILVIGGVGFVLDRIMTLFETNATFIVGLPARVGRLIKGLVFRRPVLLQGEVANAAA